MPAFLFFLLLVLPFFSDFSPAPYAFFPVSPCRFTAYTETSRESETTEHKEGQTHADTGKGRRHRRRQAGDLQRHKTERKRSLLHPFRLGGGADRHLSGLPEGSLQSALPSFRSSEGGTDPAFAHTDFCRRQGGLRSLSDRTILLSDLAEAIPPSVLLFGGKIPDLFKEKCRYHDFLEDPVFAAANALPTAESALGLVLLEREGILWKSSCALFGYGNIAKELTSRLLALGCTVTVFARREDARREAEKAGAIALPLESALELSSHFDLLFNTIPAPVISPALAAGFRAEALYMELASKPYGLSAEAKSALRCSYRLASGLPGKYCPKKAGEILADRILELYENI